MRYWWVNHKQTHKVELEEGYIWSPKTKKGGRFNKYYQNLVETRPLDVIFSYALGQVKAVGLVCEDVREVDKPSNFGSAGQRWDVAGWLVPIEWHVLEQPLTPKEFIESIRPLLPKRYSPLKENGHGNECYLTEISRELANHLISRIEQINSNVNRVLKDIQGAIQEQKEIQRINSEKISGTTRQQLIKARIGQGQFKINVEKLRLSVGLPELLIKGS